MAKKQQSERRSKTEAKPRSGLHPHLTLAEVLAVIAPALEANDPFLPDQPCWQVRLAAAGTLLAAFPIYLRDSPAKVEALLAELLPDHLYDSTQYRAQKVLEAQRASWDAVDGLRWSGLTGLYVKRYPGWMIAPWENAAKIQASRPKPIPPEQAPVIHLSDGQVALERRKALALLIPTEELEADEADVEGIEVEVAVPAW